MFLTMSIGFPYYNEQEISWKTLLLGVILWSIAGLGYGYIMKLFMNKATNKKDKNTASENV